MKITYREAFQSLNLIGSIKESGKLGFVLAKNARRLSEELVEYFEKRDELLNHYGESLGDGRFQLKGDAAGRFNEALSEYDEMEFEFEPTMVSEDVFYGGSLTSDQMYALMWMVDEQ
jgi:hypothetical protein